MPGVGNRRHLREATAMVNEMRQRYPDSAILPAHDPERLPPGPGHRPGPETGERLAMPGTKMAIDSLEAIPAGGTTQWIRIRGANASNPVLLLVQQGPGLPMINEVRRFERLLGLEQDFTVVYWDQRGCGRSLRTGPTERVSA